jgi:hypothetical protein
VVTPTMFCDCYTGIHQGKYQERLIDLDPSMVRALGLDPSQGLWPVTVTPLSGPRTTTGAASPSALPDTAIASD